ncbi:cytochrome P450 [Scytonema sp. UIC 10036]|uniref:cytochrome P450 n=1 Tax=Scytonema sp. UIC 10036 TaxID=2304196 RepID=UPI0012DA4481|nr:cytochrome P450 [Scytonema sp. UIC 10036]MUG94023.1 cytochrome P450 [Scytonema sp. UIC 10036]
MTITISQGALPLPPGHFGLPVIGETLNFLYDPRYVEKRQKQYGSIFKTSLFGCSTVIAIGAEANRYLFANEKSHLSVGWPETIKVLLGIGSLVIQTGNEHQQRRKMFHKAFQPKIMEQSISGIESITHNYLDKWERMGTLNWFPELSKYSLDVACKFLLGVETSNDCHFSKLFEEWGDGLFSIPIRLPWTKFGRALHSREQLLIRIEEIVRKRQQQSHTSQDFLGLLLQIQDEDGNKLSLQEVKDQILTFLFGGHDTVASALTSMFMFLAQSPEVLATARAEQRQLEFKEPLTLEHLKQMTYLDLVVKEVLRVTPSASFGFRKVIKEFEFNGYRIPQDWIAVYVMRRTHQDSSIYTQPERFDPQRFAPERAEDKAKPFGYVPFGGGMRECPGKEFGKLVLKLLTAMLLREYEWELEPGQNLNLVLFPTPYPYDGLRVKFRRLAS